MYGVYMWLWPTLLLIPNSKFCVLQLRDMYSCSDTHSAHVLMLRHSLLPPLLHETRSRFCMLQLVGRPEMDKVQLQRETNTGNPNKVMVRGRI